MTESPPRLAKPKGKWFAQKPERDHARACYRYILGREPESEGALESQVARAVSIADMRAAFLQSAEFRAQLAPDAWRPPPLVLPREAIATEAYPDELDRLLARAAAFWGAIGVEAPHWSVLTEERFRPERIEAARSAFYATGEVDRTLLLGLLERHGFAVPAPRLLEFGCGVGRATVSLAPHFAGTVGCDISQPHLDLASAEARARGLGNIGWHLTRPGALMPREGWDVWFSRLVLQHNAPPVTCHLLRLAFDGLRPGGMAVFQLPVHGRGYHFDLASYLASAPAGMELHAVPQAAVFALAARSGLELLEVREDSHMAAGDPNAWLSNLFVFRRPPRG